MPTKDGATRTREQLEALAGAGPGDGITMSGADLMHTALMEQGGWVVRDSALLVQLAGVRNGFGNPLPG